MYKRKNTAASRRNAEYFVKLSAPQTSRAPLEKLRLMFGGTIHVMTRAAANPRWRESWVWSVSHRGAERAIKALRGRFVVKHEASILAEQFFALAKGAYRDKEALSALEQQFRVLNKKGPK